MPLFKFSRHIGIILTLLIGVIGCQSNYYNGKLINFRSASASEKNVIINYLTHSKNTNSIKTIQSRFPYKMEYYVARVDLNHDHYHDLLAIPRDLNYFCTNKSCPLLIFLYQPMRKTWRPITITPEDQHIIFDKVVLLLNKNYTMHNLALLNPNGNQIIFCWNQEFYQQCDYSQFNRH